jgi:DNA-binding NarL/FixJ family response regulator
MDETATLRSLPSSPLRILIADDADIVRNALKELLAGRPKDWFVCAESCEGPDVLEKVRQFQTDVVLLDLSIPELSGVEVAKRLQTDYPGTTIILISAQDPAMLSRIASGVQVEHSISKSSMAKELVPLLETIAHRRHSDPQTVAASPQH